MAEEDEGAPGIADTQPAQAPGADVPLTAPRNTPTRRPPVIGSSPTVRVSPYPLRERTPPQHLSPPVASSCQRPRVSLDASPERLDQHRLQLVQDATWTVEKPAESSWTRVMQFKANGRVVPTTKTQQQWSRWAVSQRGENDTLMIYEYGFGISNARALDEFMQACIRPEHTDRSGAAAEASIREIVARLQDVWGATYQGSAVIWRMWANEITRNLNRSTWEIAVLDPPAPRVERLLQVADSQVAHHLTHLTMSTRVALDIANASIADNELLKGRWKAFGQCLENQRHALAARKETLEGLLPDIPLPALNEVTDPIN
ncbi:unnamed protein product [Phytophthora fragariaefolia]|uniref:Unnamed protein product n=1 Tax=Phytophthora fragariaefolia TaxID=1490495 RepID=A0A9W6WR43_9STRA|nr:unnamed protein product [Phytophthora fragariaefolia]